MTTQRLYGIQPSLIVHAAGCTKPAPVFGRAFLTGRPEVRCPECDATVPKHKTRETR